MRPPWPETPPPGPFRAGFWTSPLRGTRLTSLLGAALLVTLPVIALTGLLSNVAYDPRLGANAVGRHLGPLDFYLFSWPTSPSWLYAFTQGLHVTLGLATVPILLAKLWSVIPKLFEWPPVRSPAHALERASLALLVGGAGFEFITGVMNIQNEYAFGFFFTTAHFYGAWVFIAAVVLHVSLKLGTLRTALATRAEVAAVAGGAGGAGGVAEVDPLAAADPAPATMSRRVLLGTVGAGSALLFLQGAGQSIGGPLRPLAFLAPRGRTPGSGPNGFPINKTFDAAGIDSGAVDASWRLAVHGARRVTLSRSQLLALRQHTADLPIACVEGWSTTQRWTGVRLADLAALVGTPDAGKLLAVSLEDGSPYGRTTFSHGQIHAGDALLALTVNGAPLSLDHGFPARIIIPGAPGVHCTKWVGELDFRAA